MAKTDDLPAISISRSELADKVALVQPGISLEDVRRIFGDKEYRIERRQDKKAYFWRFKILEATQAQDMYEIYMGEFTKGLLTYGVQLPRG
jgi:hypothetical protein